LHFLTQTNTISTTFLTLTVKSIAAATTTTFFSDQIFFATFGPDFDLRPDLVEHLHEAVVDHERDGHVEADPRHPGDGTLVESPWTLVDHNLASAIHGISVANVIKLFTAVSYAFL